MGCKAEDSHRGKTEQCPWYMYSRECSSYKLTSLLDWEPVEKLKRRCNVISLTFFQYEASSTVLHSTKSMDRGSRKARSRGVTVIAVFNVHRIYKAY